MSDPAGLKRRRTERKQMSTTLTVSTEDGESALAEMEDVSSLGCNLRLDADWMRMGRFITASLGDNFTVTGIVRWSRDDVHGVEFLRPLASTTVDELEKLCG